MKYKFSVTTKITALASAFMVPVVATATIYNTRGIGIKTDTAPNNKVYINEFNSIANVLENIYYDDSNSRIGIGTSTPLRPLSVSGGAVFMQDSGDDLFLGRFTLGGQTGPSIGTLAGDLYVRPSGAGNTLINLFGGAVGIGLENTPVSADLKLDVEGKVGATHYCDENGDNCVAATDIGIGSGDGSSTDFRVCVQMSDRSDCSRTGEVTCSAWASDGGGWSNWATDSNGFDPDCSRVKVETRGWNAPGAIPICSGTNQALGWNGTNWLCNTINAGGGGDLPKCTATSTPIAADVIKESDGSYLFAYPGRVDVHVLGAGGSGGAASVDSGRESVATGGGAGGYARFTIPEAQSLGAARITIGKGGARVSGSGSGYHDSGNSGGSTKFSLGAYVVEAKGGKGGEASKSGCGSWGKACGVSGGTVSLSSKAKELPYYGWTGGSSSSCTKGSNAHGATGGAGPDFGFSAYDGDGKGACNKSGGDSVPSSYTTAVRNVFYSQDFYNLVKNAGGNADVHGEQNSGEAKAASGARGAGGGGAANQSRLAQSGAGGNGLALIQYYNCEM